MCRPLLCHMTVCRGQKVWLSEPKAVEEVRTQGSAMHLAQRCIFFLGVRHIQDDFVPSAVWWSDVV